MSDNLTGRFRVRTLIQALVEARKLWPGARHRAIVRSHALMLRYWPGPQNETEPVGDLDWSWIRALRELDIGELRVHERIGGCDNIRVIFFVGDRRVREPLPMIWVLTVMQKKRQDFSKADLTTFKVRRQLVQERFYRRTE